VSAFGANGGFASADFVHSAMFPIGSDVFNLPFGVTTNAPDSFIFDNRYDLRAVPGPIGRRAARLSRRLRRLWETCTAI
jgi:hypothetical protein